MSETIPQALLVKHIEENGKEHVLAVQIILPENVCKTFAAKQYKGYPTVAIQVTEDLYHIKSEELKARLRDGSDMKQWVASTKIDKWLSKQLTKQHDAHAMWRERREKEKQRVAHRKQMQLEKMEEQRKAAIEQQRLKAAMLEYETEDAQDTVQLANTRANQARAYEEKYSEWLSQEYPTPPADRQVRDNNGNRWVYCDGCNKWLPDSVMACLGGPRESMNRGVCRWCKKQTR